MFPITTVPFSFSTGEREIDVLPELDELFPGNLLADGA